MKAFCWMNRSISNYFWLQLFISTQIRLKLSTTHIYMLSSCETSVHHVAYHNVLFLSNYSNYKEQEMYYKWTTHVCHEVIKLWQTLQVLNQRENETDDNLNTIQSQKMPTRLEYILLTHHEMNIFFSFGHRVRRKLRNFSSINACKVIFHFMSWYEF